MTAVESGRHVGDEVVALPIPPHGKHRRTREVGKSVRDGVDRFLGSDPGLTRLRSASMAVAAIIVAMAAEYAFVKSTHALQIDTHGATLPAQQAALIAAQHHGVLVLGIMFGAIMALLFSFAGDANAKGLTVTGVLMPLPIIATFTLAVALDKHRIAGLALLPIALTLGTYARRWGPRGFLGGQLLFMGSFMGFLIGPEVKLSQLGWVAAEIGLGAVVGLLTRLLLFFPNPAKDLRRSQRSWIARARRALDVALRVVENPGDQRPRRSLHRQLVRLNESSLMFDALLVQPDALPAEASANRLHQTTFDLELALANVVRFAEALADLDLRPERRSAVRQTLSALRAGDQESATIAARGVIAGLQPQEPKAVLPHRFARSALDLVEAQREWLALGAEPGAGDDVGFEPAVALFNGWLPGSAMVAFKASTTKGSTRFSDRFAMPPYVRTAIQIGVAVTGAIAAGDALNGRRFYWAVLAAFVTFMATSNTGEQVRKAFARLFGTAVGIVLGIVFVHVTHGHTWASLVVILGALFLALYLIRISYVFMVLGITIMVSQLYVQLDEYSSHLLLLRLEETSIGFGVVVLTVLVVLPLRPMRVLRAAAGTTGEALVELVESAREAVVHGFDADRERRLRSAIRVVDAAWQDMLAVTKPMRRLSYGDSRDLVSTAITVSSATRHYARNLPTDLAGWGGVPAELAGATEAAFDELLGSLRRLDAVVNGGAVEAYVRSAALFDEVQRALGDDEPRGVLVFRDLALIDGALARAAEQLGLPVTDHDTLVTA